MRHSGQRGALNILLVPFILMTVFFLSAAGFTYWAYTSMTGFKANAEAIATTAAEASKAEISAQREKEFAAKEAYPFLKYESPASTGSITVQYPRGWAAYVQEIPAANSPINGYFYPNFVPYTQDGEQLFAVRLNVVGLSLDNALQQYQSYVQAGTARLQSYRSPNIPNVIGYRIDGKIDSNKQGIMILLPVRDKTVKLWTESKQFEPDYLNTILPNFSFVP